MAASATDTHANQVTGVTLAPHVYSGKRGSEPSFQSVVSSQVKWEEEKTWQLSAHFQGETLGRRDASVDLDRAWLRTGQVTWGRAHPWEVSENPNATRPWHLLAQSQPQNRGILLGEGLAPTPISPTSFPAPILLGWIGAHYWSGPITDSEFQWGLSASPFFVPSLGSEVLLSGPTGASTARFGRRPPELLDADGVRLPIRYELDRSNLLEDVLLQPQLMAQARWKETWLTLSRAPAPGPTPDTSGFLRVSDSGVQAVAVVKPRFPQLWTSTLTQRWNPSLLTSLLASSDGVSAAELRLEKPAWALSYSSKLSGPDALFLEHLVQGEIRASFRAFSGSLGAMSHLGQGDLWLRAGVTHPVSDRGNVRLGFDIFSGPDGSYFGEWRTNDRLFLNLEWQVGT
ncbi:MAG: hypothetical protein NDJ90_12295 [Oligoflexia bacterium]|nr:hypothetical protein [Oligoflexia bacterium]